MKKSSYNHLLIKLLQGAIYSDQEQDWLTLLANESYIKDYFAKMGVGFTVDQHEGFAYLSQEEDPETDDTAPVGPRLTRRMPLSYEVTMLCVCLRERLLEFDTRERDSARLIVSRQEMHEMVIPLLPERNDQVKLVIKIDSTISKAEELGFLKRLKKDAEEYEVRRILKSKLNAQKLAEIKTMMEQYGNDRAEAV